MAHLRGWMSGRGGGGWAARGWLRLLLIHKHPCCVFSRRHKQSQSTEQVETVVGYCLAPHTPLLMPFSGSTGPVVHLHGLTGLRKAACEIILIYLYQYAWCGWTVQECRFNVRL